MDRNRQTYALYTMLGWFYDLTKRFTIIIFIVVLTHLFILTVRQVEGTSMVPTYRPGDYVLVNRIDMYRGQLLRGDSVAYRFPGEASVTTLKRVIGLPGETVFIDNGHLEINGQKVEDFKLDSSLLVPTTQLASDEYFVLGDNPDASLDSRSFGGLPKSTIVGSVIGTFTYTTIMQSVREAIAAFWSRAVN